MAVLISSLSRPVHANLVSPWDRTLLATEPAVSRHRIFERVQSSTDGRELFGPDSVRLTMMSETEETFTSPSRSGLSGVLPDAPSFKAPAVNGIRANRFLIWSGFSVAASVEAFRQSQAAWGTSKGKFHFKSDFKDDGLAMSDEASHMLVAYRLSRAIEGGYRWSGAEAGRARLLGSAEAWLLTFLVEYPIDAYNPGQGFGVSDLLLNTIGIIAAYGHSAATDPRWDIKVSVKPQFFNGTGRVVAYNDKQYDDFVYWITYQPIQKRFVPLLLGVGYSTSHITPHEPVKELHLGMGTTLEEIGAMIGPKTARFLRPLNFFLFNLAAKITWR